MVIQTVYNSYRAKNSGKNSLLTFRYLIRTLQGRCDFKRYLLLCSLVNKNSCPGDKSALRPGGLRVGTPALTSRDFKEGDFEKVAEFLHQGIQLGLDIAKASGPTTKDFIATMENNEEFKSKIKALREEVEEFSAKFPMPGHEM